MNLPIAPPAFDATTGPQPRHRADRGADIGAGCGLVALELLALVAIFGLWFLSGFELDPTRTVHTDSLWNYLAAAGGVGLLALVAAAIAARAGAVVTVVAQATTAALICVIVGGGATAQSHQDRLCHDMPSAAGCGGQVQGRPRPGRLDDQLMGEIVSMSDPRVAAIPAHECGERLVDVRLGGRLLVDEHEQDGSGVFARAPGQRWICRSPMLRAGSSTWTLGSTPIRKKAREPAAPTPTTSASRLVLTGGSPRTSSAAAGLLNYPTGRAMQRLSSNTR
ncbi:DUF6234 family protein [Streptomyces sp. NPDC052301]|uniref:DUF6234 family protein n=1 Tax=Streptomyces sp. NPDC052301 TaxID=3365687 RepID=UPI0037CEB3E2